MNDTLPEDRSPRAERVFDARVTVGLRELDDLERAPDVAHEVARRLAGGERRTRPSAGAGRHAFALLAALLAIVVTATLWLADGEAQDATTTGQDPKRLQLVYRVTEALPAEGVRALRSRLAERIGVLGSVAPASETDADLVRVVLSDAADEVQVRDLVAGRDEFAMRMVATADYVSGEVRFDLAAERKRLEAWLDGGGRVQLAQDLGAIQHHRPHSPHLRWFPRRVRRHPEDPSRWGYRLSEVAGKDEVVAAYDATWWNGGVVPAAVDALPESRQFLLELVAINMHEQWFGLDSVDPTSVQLGRDGDGGGVVVLALRGEHKQRFADLSGRHIGHMLAVLWNGEVVATPKFRSRIPGVASIRGLGAGADALIRTLRNPGKLPLEFVRSEAIEKQ